jgi:hypothetical protein
MLRFTYRAIPMRQYKKKIYDHLLEYQQRFGGYTGKYLDETARIFGLNKRTLGTIPQRYKTGNEKTPRYLSVKPILRFVASHFYSTFNSKILGS